MIITWSKLIMVLKMKMSTDIFRQVICLMNHKTIKDHSVELLNEVKKHQDKLELLKNRIRNTNYSFIM